MGSYTNSALASARILITRPRLQAENILRELKRRQAVPTLFPAIEILPLPDYQAVDQALGQLFDYDWLVLTSSNGVMMLAQRWQFLQKPWAELQKIPVAVVGKKTHQAAQQLGLNLQLMPTQFLGLALADALIERGIKQKKILCLRAQLGQPGLVKRLQQAGAEVDDLAIYQTQAADPIAISETLALLHNRGLDYLTFTSPSTVHSFAESLTQAGQAPEQFLKSQTRPYIATIGPVTSQAAWEALGQVDIEAQEHSIEGLIQALEMHARARAHE